MTGSSASSDTARRLRRRSTDAERRFWLMLRDRRLDGWKFRRQTPIGSYVADFYCAEAKLIVELDGGQHAADSTHDSQRTHWLEDQGYTVIRFWNNDVLANEEGVLTTLLAQLEARAPLTLSLSREGRGNAAVRNHPSSIAAKADERSPSVKNKSSGVPSPLAGEGQGEGETTGTTAKAGEPQE